MMNPGRELSSYIVESPLGDGGSANVFLVHEKDITDQKAALKLLPKDKDSRELARFKHENELMLRLKECVYIANTLSTIHECDEGHYYFLEYLPFTFEQIRNVTPSITAAQKLKIIVSVGKGLEFAHSKLISHRDLHPGNIMFTEQEDPGSGTKIIDFGRAIDQKKLLGLSSDKTRGWGHPYYLPPEVYFRTVENDDLAQTSLADVYALGLVMYTLFAVQPAARWAELSQSIVGYYYLNSITHHEGIIPSSMDSSERQDHHDSWQLRSIDKFSSDLITELPDEPLQDDINRIVAKAANIDRTKRYESISAMIIDIEALI